MKDDQPTVGIRELRQNPTAAIARVEHGEEVVVTVSGRAVAKLVPIGPAGWISAARAASIYDTPVDTAFWDDVDAARSATEQDDPWSRR